MNERLPEGMEICFKRLGALDFAKLAEDGYLDIAREDNGEPVSMSMYERNKWSLSVGQHDENDMLTGIGRKIRIASHAADIWEGSFKDG